jgi:hypothetical protein
LLLEYRKEGASIVTHFGAPHKNKKKRKRKKIKKIVGRKPKNI